MALSDAVNRKTAWELIDWLYLGIRTGSRKSVEVYREAMAEAATLPAGAERDEVEAQGIAHLRRAVDMPRRTRARIEYALSQLPGTRQQQIQALNDILALADPGVTVADLDAELTALENYCQGLVDDFGAGAKGYDDIATDIEAQVEHEALRWRFPLPPGYVDIWGG